MQLCTKNTLLSPSPFQSDYLEAELSVGFQVFTEAYTSRVYLNPGKGVRVSSNYPHPDSARVLEAGFPSLRLTQALSTNTQLFERLETSWSFEPAHEVTPVVEPLPRRAVSSFKSHAATASGASSCWVSFRVEFAFRSAIYAQASQLFLDEVAGAMMSAFENRCRAVAEANKALLPEAVHSTTLARSSLHRTTEAVHRTGLLTTPKPLSTIPTTYKTEPQGSNRVLAVPPAISLPPQTAPRPDVSALSHKSSAHAAVTRPVYRPISSRSALAAAAGATSKATNASPTTARPALRRRSRPLPIPTSDSLW